MKLRNRGRLTTIAIIVLTLIKTVAQTVTGSIDMRSEAIEISSPNGDESFGQRLLDTKYGKTCNVDIGKLRELQKKTNESIFKFKYSQKSTDCNFIISDQTDCCQKILSLLCCLIDNFTANLLRYFENCESIIELRNLNISFNIMYDEFQKEFTNLNSSTDKKYVAIMNDLQNKVYYLQGNITWAEYFVSKHIEHNFVKFLSDGDIKNAFQLFPNLRYDTNFYKLTRQAFEIIADENEDPNISKLIHVKPISDFAKKIMNNNGTESLDILKALTESMKDNGFERKLENIIVHNATKTLFDFFENSSLENEFDILQNINEERVKWCLEDIAEYIRNISNNEANLNLTYVFINEYPSLFTIHQESLIKITYDCQIKYIYNIIIFISMFEELDRTLACYSILLKLMWKHDHLDIPEIMMLAYKVKDLEYEINETLTKAWTALEQSMPEAVRDFVRKDGSNCEITNRAYHPYKIYLKYMRQMPKTPRFLKLDNTINAFIIIEKYDLVLSQSGELERSKNSFNESSSKWYFTPAMNATHFRITVDGYHLVPLSHGLSGTLDEKTYRWQDIYKINCA